MPNPKDKRTSNARNRVQKAIRERQLNEMLMLFDQYGKRKKLRKFTGKQWKKGSL